MSRAEFRNVDEAVKRASRLCTRADDVCVSAADGGGCVRVETLTILGISSLKFHEIKGQISPLSAWQTHTHKS